MSVANDGGNSSTGSSKAPHLVKYQWPKGYRPAGAGKPKGLVSLRRRFRDAFTEAPPGDAESLVNVVLAMARGKIVKMEKVVDEDGIRFEYCYVESKNQFAAIKLAAEYGFGAPPKALDDETTQKLAAQMVAGMLAEARARAAERASAIETTVTTAERTDEDYIAAKAEVDAVVPDTPWTEETEPSST